MVLFQVINNGKYREVPYVLSSYRFGKWKINHVVVSQFVDQVGKREESEEVIPWQRICQLIRQLPRHAGDFHRQNPIWKEVSCGFHNLFLLCFQYR